MQGYGRDYLVLIVFVVDRFDGVLTCFYERNFQDEEDEMFNEGGMRYVCYGSGGAWKGEVVNEKLWFLSTASEKLRTRGSLRERFKVAI